MATPEQCQAAIVELAAKFGHSKGNDTGGLDRTISAHITDLDLRFHGRMHDGVLDQISTDEPAAPPQVRMAMTSDDLLALAAGDLSIGSAWLSGRLKVHASFGDILRMRSMI